MDVCQRTGFQLAWEETGTPVLCRRGDPRSRNGLIRMSADETFTINALPSPNLSTEPNVTLCDGASTVLTAQADDGTLSSGMPADSPPWPSMARSPHRHRHPGHLHRQPRGDGPERPLPQSRSAQAPPSTSAMGMSHRWKPPRTSRPPSNGQSTAAPCRKHRGYLVRCRRSSHSRGRWLPRQHGYPRCRSLALPTASLSTIPDQLVGHHRLGHGRDQSGSSITD